MTSLNKARSIARSASVVLLVASVALGVGCGKKKKPAPPPPPPPKPVAVIPDPIDVNGLLQTMKSDARVQFPQDRSPADRSLAEGVIKLANALCKGDAAAMKPLLDAGANSVLDELVSSGGWDDTKNIEAVRIVSLSGTTDARAESSLIGFAVQGRDGAYLLAWNGKRDGDAWKFAAAPCQADVKPRASDFDGTSISAGVDAPSITQVSAEESGSKPGKKAEAAPEAAPDPSGPRKKSTPVGPITIPGPGGNR